MMHAAMFLDSLDTLKPTTFDLGSPMMPPRGSIVCTGRQFRPSEANKCAPVTHSGRRQFPPPKAHKCATFVNLGLWSFNSAQLSSIAAPGGYATFPNPLLIHEAAWDAVKGAGIQHS